MKLWERVPNVAVGVIVGLIAGGGVFAWAQTAKSGDGGVHGGPKPRYHDASACNLVDVSGLEGNWTHGDYVKAVASADPSKVNEAARSRCGKPAKDGDRGNSGKSKSQKSEKSPGPGDKAGGKPSKSPTPAPTPSPAGSASASPSLSPSPSPDSSPTGDASPSDSVSPSPSGS